MELFAFVLMPFSKKFDDIYRFGIKKPAQELGIRAERVDEQIFSEGILDRIYRQIEAADVIVADMTGQNANVFYEVGYVHAKGKICLLVTQNADDIPFDLKHRRHIVYDGSIKNLAAALTKDLLWAKAEIEGFRKTRIKIEVQSIWADLEKTKHEAKAVLRFKIDLRNEAERSSPEIEAIYLYSGTGWSFVQDGKDCPSRKSDIPNFKLQHFITPSVKRLTKGAWARLEFRGSRVMANVFRGDELKDSYKINGRCVLRLATSEGNIDHEFLVEAEAEEVPF
jgi:hypothetical protein